MNNRFDMYLTATYPKDPPKMVFTLENADTDGHPINPNLHVGSGTVCLSLLNTWVSLTISLAEAEEPTVGFFQRSCF